jgi:hypothetical protein
MQHDRHRKCNTVYVRVKLASLENDVKFVKYWIRFSGSALNGVRDHYPIRQIVRGTV